VEYTWREKKQCSTLGEIKQKQWSTLGKNNKKSGVHLERL